MLLKLSSDQIELLRAAEDVLRECAKSRVICYHLGIGDEVSQLSSMADAIADAYWVHLPPEERGEVAGSK
jgi:hypothetical protein